MPAHRRNQQINENKLRRIQEYNLRLHEQLDAPRIPVSEAAQSLIDFCSRTNDPLVSGVREDDPFAPTSKKLGCCNIS